MNIDDDEVSRLRVALTRISRQVDRQAHTEGLTRAQMSVLGTIVRAGDESIGLGELADTEGLNPTMLSRIVGNLETAGLIRRETEPTDRRAARVRATARGTALHRRLRQERSRVLGEALQRLPDRQVGKLVQALPALESLADTILARRTVTIGPATPQA